MWLMTGWSALTTPIEHTSVQRTVNSAFRVLWDINKDPCNLFAGGQPGSDTGRSTAVNVQKIDLDRFAPSRRENIVVFQMIRNKGHINDIYRSLPNHIVRYIVGLSGLKLCQIAVSFLLVDIHLNFC